MRKIGCTLKIHTGSLVPLGDTVVELDGHNITHAVSDIQVKFDADDVTKATINFLVEKLDVTAETLAMLQAHVETRKA